MQPAVAGPSERLIDLLAEWEEQRLHGRILTAEELCPDDAELCAELRSRIARRKQMSAVFDLPTLGEGEAPPPSSALPQVAGYEILEVIGHGGMGVV